jgi:hypothetical protein
MENPQMEFQRLYDVSHLAKAEACRRDRRKDALLQKHGYFVLRFFWPRPPGNSCIACSLLFWQH